MSPECDPVSLGRLYTGLRLALEEGQERGARCLALRYAIIVNERRSGGVAVRKADVFARCVWAPKRPPLWRQQLIDGMEAIMRERNSNSRTSARRSPPKAAKATLLSLTSNSSRAPLRHANNEEIRPRSSFHMA